MQQEDYVSFEVAKLLKEKGYKGFTSKTLCGEYSDATLWDAQKWLRNEHALSIEPKNTGFEDEWECYIMNIITGRISQCCEHIDTYEQALNEGIKEALEMI